MEAPVNEAKVLETIEISTNLKGSVAADPHNHQHFQQRTASDGVFITRSLPSSFHYLSPGEENIHRIASKRLIRTATLTPQLRADEDLMSRINSLAKWREGLSIDPDLGLYESYLLASMDHRKRVFGPSGELMTVNTPKGVYRFDDSDSSDQETMSLPASPTKSPKKLPDIQHIPRWFSASPAANETNATKIHPIQQVCQRLSCSRWMDRIMNAIVIANVVVLIYDNPNDMEKQKSTERFLWILELLFAIAYTSEAIIKIAAKGLYLWRNPYFSDWWNRLDFTVAVLCLTTAILAISKSYSAIRVLRILRPLRALYIIPGMKVVINSVLRAVSQLFGIGIFMLFLVLLFSVIGVQLWAGKLSGRCYAQGELVLDDLQPCDLSGGLGRKCDLDQVCLDSGATPIYNTLDFDNVGRAYLTLIVLTTVQGWISIVDMLIDSDGPIVMVYILCLLVLVSMLGVNLTLAVLNDAFIDAQDINSPFRALILQSRASHNEPNGKEASSISKPAEETSPLQLTCKSITEHHTYKTIVVILILLNTLIMTTDYFGAPESVKIMINYSSMVFTFLFAVEFILNVIAIGFQKAIHSKYLIFDFIVVFFSSIDIFLIKGESGVRAVHLIRIFRLKDVWMSFRRLIDTLLSSMRSILLVALLLCIFLFASGIVGYQLFYGVFTKDSPPEDRSNFQDVYFASLTSFQIITGDNWSDLMLQVIQTKGPLSALYFILNIVIGNYLILNIFLAVILEYFALAAFKSKIEEKRKRRIVSIRRKIQSNATASRNKMKSKQIIDPNKLAQHNTAISSPDPSSQQGPHTDSESPPMPGVDSPMKAVVSFSNTMSTENDDQSEFSEVLEGEIDKIEKTLEDDAQDLGANGKIMEEFIMDLELTKRCSTANLWEKTKASSRKLEPNEGENSRPQNEATNKRLFFTDIVAKYQQYKSKRPFKRLMFSSILASCILLYLYAPKPEDSGSTKTLWVSIESILVAFHLSDLLLCGASEALFGNFQGFVLNPWYQMDIVVVVASAVSLMVDSSDSSGTKFLYFLRALRPFRLMNRSKDLRIVISSMLRSVPNIVNLVMIIFLFFLMFSIISVRFFGGKFYYCNDPTVHLRSECVGFFIEDGLLLARVWENPINTFDSTIASLISWFQVATYDNWHTIMYQAVDAYKVDHNPVYNYNLAATIPFVIFQLGVGFFLVSVFVAILIDSFVHIREEINGQALLTPSQREWVNAIGLMLRIRPKMLIRAPTNPRRRWAFDISSSYQFKQASLVTSVVHFIFLACQHARPSELFYTVSNGLKILFAVMYTLEAMLKIYSTSIRTYLRKVWNRLDFLVVMCSWFEIGCGVSIPISPIRLFRLLHHLQKIRYGIQIRIMYQTIVVCIPPLLNVGAIVAIHIITYAMVGVVLFGDVENGDFVNNTFNFRTHSNAVLALGMIVSGDQWTDAIADCLASGLHCQDDEYGCGKEAVVYAYFVSFQFCVAFLLLNLFATVIIESYSSAVVAEESAFQISHCNMFRAAWMQFDPDASGLIPFSKLAPLLKAMGPPLGFDPDKPPEQIDEIIRQMSIPQDAHGNISFHFTLHALTERLVGADLPACEMVESLENRLTVAYSSRLTNQVSAYPILTSAINLLPFARQRTNSRGLGSAVQLSSSLPTDAQQQPPNVSEDSNKSTNDVTHNATASDDIEITIAIEQDVQNDVEAKTSLDEAESDFNKLSMQHDTTQTASLSVENRYSGDEKESEKHNNQESQTCQNSDLTRKEYDCDTDANEIPLSTTNPQEHNVPRVDESQDTFVRTMTPQAKSDKGDMANNFIERPNSPDSPPVPDLSLPHQILSASIGTANKMAISRRRKPGRSTRRRSSHAVEAHQHDEAPVVLSLHTKRTQHIHYHPQHGQPERTTDRHTVIDVELDFSIQSISLDTNIQKDGTLSSNK